MKMNTKYLRSKKSLSVILIALISVSACKSMEFLKQKVENKSEFQASPAIEFCGTMLSLGSINDESGRGISLKVQAAVCGYLEGNEEAWQAIGLTIDTSEVFLSQGEKLKSVKSDLSLVDDKLFAVLPDKKILLGTVQGEVTQDASVKLLEQIKVEILVEGKPYLPGSIEDKMEEKNLEILFTMK
jgi:hypothetical protein